MDRSRTHEPVRGFTLIEVAVVVAVIAALMTLGLSFLNAQLISSAKTITTKKQEAIKDALIAFLGTHQRLPCPDVPDLPVGSGIDGKEDRQGAIGSEICARPFGIVPYAALGLSREAAIDGWSNFFSYRVFQGIPTGAPADAAPLPEPCGTTADWTQKRCFGAGKNGGISVNGNAVTATPNDLTKTAIAVVISHGSNGLAAWVGATPTTRNVLPPDTQKTCEERRNADLGTPDCTAPSLPGNTYFLGGREDLDDVVTWIDAKEAINALAKQGAIKSAIAQINDDLQTLADMALGVKRASITISPPPSAPTGCDVPVNLNTVLASMRDPWGNSYVVNDASGGFPICIYSNGGGPEICAQPTCTTTVTPTAPPAPPNPPAICKSIDKVSFNAYLAKAGSEGCP